MMKNILTDKSSASGATMNKSFGKVNVNKKLGAEASFKNPKKANQNSSDNKRLQHRKTT